MALDENYWMFVHKVAPCPLRERHDWSACPYAHRGERAARRCPQTCNYSAQPCPEYNKKGLCPRGETCPLAHSVFESWLHPSRFRTQLCCFGPSCHRRICFFAHDASQLRTVTGGSTPCSSGPVLRRTQAVVPAPFTRTGSSPASSSRAPVGALHIHPEPQILAAHSSSAASLMQQRVQAPEAAVVAPGAAAALAQGSGWVLAGQGWSPLQVPTLTGSVGAQQPSIGQFSVEVSEAASVSADMSATLARQFDGLVLQQRLLPVTQSLHRGHDEQQVMMPPSLAVGGVTFGPGIMQPSLASSSTAHISNMGMPGPARNVTAVAAAELFANLGRVPSVSLLPTSLGTPAQLPHDMSRLGQQDPGGWQ